MGCLYKLTSPSGKSYIGVSRYGLESRWTKHVRNAVSRRDPSALCDALRRYGADAFERTILDECDDWNTLLSLEVEAIARFGTIAPNGYNLTAGGEGSLGAVPSAAARQRMSKAQKRRLEDPEQHAALMVALAAARVASKKPWTPERRQRHGESVRDGHARPEAKVRVIASAREKAARPGWGEMLSRAQRGCKKGPCTEERRTKLREIRRMEWADPAMRAKRLAGFAVARARKAASQ